MKVTLLFSKMHVIDIIVSDSSMRTFLKLQSYDA